MLNCVDALAAGSFAKHINGHQIIRCVGEAQLHALACALEGRALREAEQAHTQNFKVHSNQA